MSFDKTYPNRKDWRRPYRGSKAFDRSCRHHGGCAYCERNRTISQLRVAITIRAELRALVDNDVSKDTVCEQQDHSPD